MAAESNYIPGMCNINPKEIAQRRNIGHIGLAVTLVFVAVCLALDINMWFRILVFAPAFLAATGYLQARNKFCVGYAGAKQHHADDGSVVDITEASALAADKKKARTINLQAFGIALVVALVVLIIPSF